MAEIPVEIISSGYSYACQHLIHRSSSSGATYSGEGVDGVSVDVEVVLSQDLGALVDGTARSIENTAKHVLGHTDLQTLASELDFGLYSSASQILHSHENFRHTFFTSIPDVPSKTCTVLSIVARWSSYRSVIPGQRHGHLANRVSIKSFAYILRISGWTYLEPPGPHQHAQCHRAG